MEPHPLRHTALTEATEQGADTGTLLAYSDHSSVRSLARYTRVSPTALGTWQQKRDPTTADDHAGTAEPDRWPRGQRVPLDTFEMPSIEECRTTGQRR
jgi:hypothetical protein